MFEFDTKKVKSIAEKDGALLQRCRFWTASVLLKMGSEAYLLQVRDGAVVDFIRDDKREEADIVVSGPSESWVQLFKATPPPGFQDPLFSDGRSGMSIQGDIVHNVAPYYPAVQELIRILRHVRSGGESTPVMRVVRDFDDAIGRYMYVDIQGVQYRIYYEEAGRGAIPLIMQHTAGADSRQWRHVLEDADYQKHYRMISYDLPFHGKSVPPTSQRWWDTQYKLTKSFLMEAVVSISRKLNLDRPVFMGCSVGGLLAPDLALYHPESFRAVIGVNSGLAVEFDESQFEKIKNMSNPRVGNQLKEAVMRSNTSPTSPEAYRRETTWVYSQGAPAVLEGDMYYYTRDHDLTAQQAAKIDTKKVAVYLITGEYDILANEEFGTAQLAKAIAGSHFVVGPGSGHFGPAENPDAFKSVLWPCLQEIAKSSASTVDRADQKERHA